MSELWTWRVPTRSPVDYQHLQIDINSLCDWTDLQFKSSKCKFMTRKCTTLWGLPDRVHAQNMEQLHAFDCHQSVAEPQATENHRKYTHVYTGTVNQAWL